MKISKEIWQELYNQFRERLTDDRILSRQLGSEHGFLELTFGLSLPIFVEDVIEKAKITEDDVFLDIGSGIGNIVFQMAARVFLTV